MVYRANSGWVYSHQCTDNHKHVEGPFSDDFLAGIALKEHEEKCNG